MLFADPTQVPPNAAAAIIVAVGTAVGAIAGVLRLRASRNGTDGNGLKAQLADLQSRYDTDRKADIAERQVAQVERQSLSDRLSRIENRLDDMLLYLAENPPRRSRPRAPGGQHDR